MPPGVVQNLRRQRSAHRQRERHRGAGLRAGALRGDPSRAPGLLVPQVRDHGAGADAGAADSARHGRCELPRAHDRRQVLRPHSALSPGRDRCARRRRDRSQPARRMARPHGLAAQPPRRADCGPRDGRPCRSTPTTRRSTCWRRARARRRPAGSGSICATSARMPAPRRRPCSIATRPTARASTAARSWPTSPAGCTPTATPASPASTRSAAMKASDAALMHGPPRVAEVGCWSHVRRGFFDEYVEHKGAIAKEALDRIGALFDIERPIAGSPPDIRRAVRQRTARPKIDELAIWLDAQLAKIPGKSDLAKAIRYARSRWPALDALSRRRPARDQRTMPRKTKSARRLWAERTGSSADRMRAAFALPRSTRSSAPRA